MCTGSSKCLKRLFADTRQQKLFVIQKGRKKKKNLSRILFRSKIFPLKLILLLSVAFYHERLIINTRESKYQEYRENIGGRATIRFTLPENN